MSEFLLHLVEFTLLRPRSPEWYQTVLRMLLEETRG